MSVLHPHAHVGHRHLMVVVMRKLAHALSLRLSGAHKERKEIAEEAPVVVGLRGSKASRWTVALLSQQQLLLCVISNRRPTARTCFALCPLATPLRAATMSTLATMSGPSPRGGPRTVPCGGTWLRLRARTAFCTPRGGRTLRLSKSLQFFYPKMRPSAVGRWRSSGGPLALPDCWGRSEEGEW